MSTTKRCRCGNNSGMKRSNGKPLEVHWSSEQQAWLCGPCFFGPWEPEPPAVEISPTETDVVDHLRHVNQRLHRLLREQKAKHERDMTTATLQAHRPWLQPWEQAQLTEAIDAALDGRNVLDYLPPSLLLRLPAALPQPMPTPLSYAYARTA